ncbi:MAG: hypothetical protein ACRD0K_30840, partial [Egibacteraceae bacterium]
IEPPEPRSAPQVKAPVPQTRSQALQRKGEVLSLGRDGRLDSALALLAPLQEQVPTSAVTGSWAAVEGLLIGPGEDRRSQAADRLAALVACSWPRAELTSLAHRHQRERSDAIGIALDAAATNRERSRIVAEALTGGARLRLSRLSDQAGLGPGRGWSSCWPLRGGRWSGSWAA